jgi:hypothetical protein
LSQGATLRRITFFSSLSCVLALATSALGCGHGDASGGSTTTASTPAPPTEPWTEIASEAAPLLISVTEEFPPPEIVRRGELLRVGGSRRVTTWKGLVDDVEVTRDGMVFGVQRAKDGALAYAFQTDLGGEIAVTSTTWLCDQLAKQPALTLTSCASNLRRARAADGAIISYLPCGTGACPVTVERAGKLGTIAIDGLSNAHFFTGKKKSVLVAETRFVKEEGKVTGGAVEIVTLDGAEPVRSAKFDADGVDARDADHVVSKVVKIGVTRAELRISGRSEEHGPGGKLVRGAAIDEKHALPPLD